MGVPHSRKGRVPAAQTPRVDGRRPRVAKRARVDDDRPEPVDERDRQAIVLVQSSPQGEHGGRVREEGRTIEAEFIDGESRDPPAGGRVAREQVPAPQVIDAKVVGYWDEVVDMTGRALAGLVSEQIRRVLK